MKLNKEQANRNRTRLVAFKKQKTACIRLVSKKKFVQLKKVCVSIFRYSQKNCFGLSKIVFRQIKASFGLDINTKSFFLCVIKTGARTLSIRVQSGQSATLVNDLH
jgi:hypothetical protein